jgi:hypothetical protein
MPAMGISIFLSASSRTKCLIPSARGLLLDNISTPAGRAGKYASLNDRAQLDSSTQGVFAAMAQQPGCAPGLQLLCLRRLAGLRARLCACKLSLSAWLHRNELRVRFLGAWLLVAQGFRV